MGTRRDSRPDGPEVKPAGRRPAPRRGTRNRARQPPGPEGPTGRGQTPAEVAGDRSPTPCKDTAAPRTLRSSLPAPSGSSETKGRARARSPPPGVSLRPRGPHCVRSVAPRLHAGLGPSAARSRTLSCPEPGTLPARAQDSSPHVGGGGRPPRDTGLHGRLLCGGLGLSVSLSVSLSP